MFHSSEHRDPGWYFLYHMMLIDDVQVFSLREVVADDLWQIPPGEAEKRAREWCLSNDAVYGTGSVDSLVELVKSSGKAKVVLAES